MTDYTIPAIPTVYRGRRYRSRLEARWAAFFDLLGWSHEYEPFDLSGWIPDFLLRGRWGAHTTAPRQVLVEIKPIGAFDAAIGSKMQQGLYGHEAADGVPLGDDLLLLGVAPEKIGKSVRLGWDVTIDDDVKVVGREVFFKCFINDGLLKFDYTDGHIVGGVLTAFESWFTWNNRNEMYRPDLLDSSCQAEDCCEIIRQLWVEATNRAQWKKPGSERL